jgi:hypothetical protein
VTAIEQPREGSRSILEKRQLPTQRRRTHAAAILDGCPVFGKVDHLCLPDTDSSISAGAPAPQHDGHGLEHDLKVEEWVLLPLVDGV